MIQIRLLNAVPHCFKGVLRDHQRIGQTAASQDDTRGTMAIIRRSPNNGPRFLERPTQHIAGRSPQGSFVDGGPSLKRAIDSVTRRKLSRPRSPVSQAVKRDFSSRRIRSTAPGSRKRLHDLVVALGSRTLCPRHQPAPWHATTVFSARRHAAILKKRLCQVPRSLDDERPDSPSPMVLSRTTSAN